MSARIFHWLPLAHHRRDELERCFLVPVGGGRRLALCARCCGVYPALVAALLLQGALRLGPAGPADWLMALSGIFPALFDWGLSWLGRQSGGEPSEGEGAERSEQRAERGRGTAAAEPRVVLGRGEAGGSNALRLATGAVLGLSLGRGFWLYFRDPRCEVFWVQMGLLVIGAFAFEVVRRLRI